MDGPKYFKRLLFTCEKESIIPSRLKFILSVLQTITTIYFRNIAPEYVHPIFKIFGSELLQLQFSFKSKFYVEDLASASRLESLLIGSHCELMMRSKEDATLLRDDNFLPQLKKLESGSCLGSLSYLFEKKTTLEKLTLECCHIGAEIDQDRPKKRFKPAAEVNNIFPHSLMFGDYLNV